jgi:hypothetical protein
MAAVPLNLTLEQGADFNVNFTVRNKDLTPLNLLGYTASSEMRKHHTSTRSYSFSITFVDRVQGKISIGMSDAITATISEGRYVYDVFIESSNGTKTKVIAGMVLVHPGVSF